MTTNRKNTKNKTLQTSKTIEELETENKAIQQDIQVLKKELTYFKEYAVELERKLNVKTALVQSLKNHNRALTIERNNLQLTVDNIKSDIVGYDAAVMESEILAEQHENEVVSAMGSYLEDY